MNTNTALDSSAAMQKTLAPDDEEDRMFLEAIQDPEKRKTVISILKRAGSIPG